MDALAVVNIVEDYKMGRIPLVETSFLLITEGCSAKEAQDLLGLPKELIIGDDVE